MRYIDKVIREIEGFIDNCSTIGILLYLSTLPCTMLALAFLVHPIAVIPALGIPSGYAIYKRWKHEKDLYEIDLNERVFAPNQEKSLENYKKMLGEQGALRKDQEGLSIIVASPEEIEVKEREKE
jgi:hypothetical protein